MSTTDSLAVSPDLFATAATYAAGIEWDTEKAIEGHADIDSDEDGPKLSRKDSLNGFANAYIERITEEKGWSFEDDFQALLNESLAKERDAL